MSGRVVQSVVLQATLWAGGGLGTKMFLAYRPAVVPEARIDLVDVTSQIAVNQDEPIRSC